MTVIQRLSDRIVRALGLPSAPTIELTEEEIIADLLHGHRGTDHPVPPVVIGAPRGRG